MKHISLQWRMTLMTSLLIAVTCMVMNFFMYGSGSYYMELIGESFSFEDSQVEEIQIESTDEGLYFDPGKMQKQGEASIVITTAQERYRMTSYYITAIISVISGVIAYFVSGRALKPLHDFEKQAQKLEMSNLGELRFDEKMVVELAQLSYSMNEMLSRLDAGFQSQRQFTGNAAHELRTPLALMQAKLELFVDEHPNVLPETSEFLTGFQEQLERMTKLAKTLLEMSDIHSIPRTSHIHLAPLIEEVFMDIAPLADKKSISLKSEGDAGIFCSETLIYRLLYNLTENAIKYNHDGGSVCVLVREQDENIIIDVADTGIGIPKEYHDSIFQPFYRVDKSRSREMGGAGLGLSMVREIARCHGGDIKIWESSEKGTVIRVWLMRDV